MCLLTSIVYLISRKILSNLIIEVIYIYNQFPGHRAQAPENEINQIN